MKRPRLHTPSTPMKGELICPTCGYTSPAIDGDWIEMDGQRSGRRFRCPTCGESFGDQPTPKAIA